MGRGLFELDIAMEYRREQQFWDRRPGAEHFKNELGNEISLAVYEQDIDGVKGVMIYIRGPKSDTENHITRMEAEKMYAQLGRVLGKTEKD